MKNQIKNRIAREKRTKAYDDYVQSLMAKAKVQVHEDRLGDVKVGSAARKLAPPKAPAAAGSGAKPKAAPKPAAVPKPADPSKP